MKSFLLAIASTLFTVTASAQTLDVTKTCPGSAAVGETITCHFTVVNNTSGTITTLSVRNELPNGSGNFSSPLPCISSLTGLPTTTLAAGDDCSDDGNFTETVLGSYCGGGGGGVMQDRLYAQAATGHGAIVGTATADVTIPTCTPTNTPTATPTPTPTRTNTPGPSGLQVGKSCPPTVAGGTDLNCTFTVMNLSFTDTVNGLLVYDNITGPPGVAGTIVGPWQCNGVSGVTTTLAPRESCNGTMSYGVSFCSGFASIVYTDKAVAFGTGIFAYFSPEQSSTVLACTPTPTITPNVTPTPAPSGGIDVFKSCDTPVATGGTINCTVQVTNNSGIPGVSGRLTSMTLTNLVPYPGGLSSSLQCKIGATVVSALDDGQSCVATFTETAPSCSAGTFNDRVTVGGHINAFGTISVVEDFGVTITGITCTPTNTPTATNTPTPAVTATNTPTITGTPPTSTPTPTRTATFPATVTPTPTRTNTPTRTPTSGPTRTPTPRPAVCGTTLYGTIRNASGSTNAINGVVWFELSGNGDAACCIPPFQIGPGAPVTFTLTNGVIQGGALLIGTDCIAPATRCYLETVINKNGAVVSRRNVKVLGASQDIGAFQSCTPH